MAFDIKSIPDLVVKLFLAGTSQWTLGITLVANFGITSSDDLTDIVFFLRHPERGSKPLDAGETAVLTLSLSCHRRLRCPTFILLFRNAKRLLK